MSIRQVILMSIFLLFSLCGIAQVPTDGLVAEYSFNDGTGDEPINNLDATFIGDVDDATDRFGNEKKAKKLNGDLGSYINLGSSSLLKNIGDATISMWVKAEKEPNINGYGNTWQPLIIAKSNSNEIELVEGYALYRDFEEEKMVGVYNSTSSDIYITTYANEAIIGDKWEHVVLTYSEKNKEVVGYINAIEVFRESTEGALLTFSVDDVIVGLLLAEHMQRAFHGSVDDIRIYNKSLGQAQISQLHQEKNPKVIITPYFYTPKLILDGSYAKMIDESLNLKFTQEYATSDGTEINFEVYDWQRGITYQGIFNVNYGINWKELDISSWSLNAQTFYTLEFKANKGQLYKIRFKTPQL
jgi:hypothetical protein